jgi:hypothetical protein
MLLDDWQDGEETSLQEAGRGCGHGDCAHGEGLPSDRDRPHRRGTAWILVPDRPGNVLMGGIRSCERAASAA